METIRQAYSNKYPDKPFVPAYFSEATGQTFEWENMTKANLSKFSDFLCERLAKKSAKTYCAYLKAVLNLYSDQISLPRGWETALSVKNDTTEQIYLTEKELRKVTAFIPDSVAEAIVQQQFLLGAFTGARHSDFVKFTAANIRDNMLRYVSQKTHIKVNVPVSPTVRMILESEPIPADVTTNTPISIFATRRHEKYGYLPLGFYRLQLSDVGFNAALRRILQKCHIDQEMTLYRRGKFVTGKKYEFASSHAARRSFACALYLRGADVYDIARMLGHSDVQMTVDNYIVCGLREISPKVRGFFAK